MDEGNNIYVLWYAENSKEAGYGEVKWQKEVMQIYVSRQWGKWMIWSSGVETVSVAVLVATLKQPQICENDQQFEVDHMISSYEILT